MDSREARVAVAKLAVDVSCRSAATRWGLTKSTVHNHRTGHYNTTRRGRPPTLSREEEKEIVRCCQVLADTGFGVTRAAVNEVDVSILTSPLHTIAFN